MPIVRFEVNLLRPYFTRALNDQKNGESPACLQREHIELSLNIERQWRMNILLAWFQV